MKTTSSNAAKEIRTGILLVVFTIALFAAFKVKELQVNESNNDELTKTNRIIVNHTGVSSLPVLDATLIEEPVLEVESWMTSDSYWGAESENEVVEAEPVLKIESWMTDNNYWSGTNAEEVVEAEPALEIESWMNSNSYWSGTNAEEVAEAELTLEIKSWMMTDSYWTGDPTPNVEAETVEGESPLTIELWMNNSQYWMANK